MSKLFRKSSSRSKASSNADKDEASVAAAAPSTSPVSTKAEKPVDPWCNDEIKKVEIAWSMSEKEKEKLLTLGERLRDIDHHKNVPDMVIRFIKARRTIDQAEKMFRDMIQWRIDNKVDTILQDYMPPRLIRDYTPGAVLDGYTSDGDPIYVERIGSADSREMLRRYGEEHLVKHAIWIREQIANGDWIEEYERRQGRKVRQIMVIEDLKGLSSNHLDRKLLDAFQKITRLDQDNYPEAASKLLNVNAPFILRMAWSLVKHFFDQNVAEKMVFASASNTQEVLEKYIGDLTVLPKEIVPEGRGTAAKGLNPNFKGGKLPPEGEVEEDEDDYMGPSHRKESATTEQDEDDSDGIDIDIDTHSTSGLSTRTYLSWARPVKTFMDKQEMKKVERKEEEIRQIRQAAAQRIQPKKRSESKQERLVQLREAQARRQHFQQDPVAASTVVVKAWSEKLTDHLERHGQIRRFVNMSGLLLLFFALLHPEIVELFLGVKIKPVDSESPMTAAIEDSDWLSAASQGLGLFAYLLFCAVIHFGVCDISLVYAYVTLDLGSRTGREVKKFYSEKVRMAVAGMSFGIYVLSLTRALANVLLSLFVSGLSKLLQLLAQQAKEHTGLVWTMIADKLALIENEKSAVSEVVGEIEVFGEVETFGEVEVYNQTNTSSLMYNQTNTSSFMYNQTNTSLLVHNETHTSAFETMVNATEMGGDRAYFSWIRSFVAVDDVETAFDSWQANAFNTARLFFSYTSVFLLVFLVLFNQTASSQLVKTINDHGKKQSSAVAEDDSDTEVSTITPSVSQRTRATLNRNSPSIRRDDQSVMTQSTAATANSKKRRFRLRRKGATETK